MDNDFLEAQAMLDQKWMEMEAKSFILLEGMTELRNNIISKSNDAISTESKQILHQAATLVFAELLYRMAQRSVEMDENPI